MATKRAAVGPGTFVVTLVGPGTTENVTVPTLTVAIDQTAPTVGDTLTLTTNAAAGAAYQWTRAGVDISGATSATYTTVTADNGQAVRCRVTSGAQVITSAPVTVGAAAGARNSLIPGTAADPFALTRVWANLDGTGALTLADNGDPVLSVSDAAGSLLLAKNGGFSDSTLLVSGDDYRVVMGEKFRGATERTGALTGNWSIFARVRASALTGRRSIFIPNGPNGAFVLNTNEGVLTLDLYTGSTGVARTGQTLAVDTNYNIVVEREAGVGVTFYVNATTPVVTASLANGASTGSGPGIGESGGFGFAGWAGSIGSVGIMRALAGSTLRDKFMAGPLEASDMSAFDHFWPM